MNEMYHKVPQAYLSEASFKTLQQWIDWRFGDRSPMAKMTWWEFWGNPSQLPLTQDANVNKLLTYVSQLSQDNPPARNRMEFMHCFMNWYPHSLGLHYR